jgi:hypothetical protein
MRYCRGQHHIYFLIFPVLKTPFGNPAILAGVADILRNYYREPDDTIGITCHLVII